MKHEALTAEIINSFYKVYNTLGHGFLERVYENAMLIELRKRRIFCEKQKQIKVYYEGEQVGDYFADIVTDGKVILELKAAKGLTEENELQLINSNTQDSSKTEEASIFNTKNPERSSKKTQSSRNNSSNSLGKKSGSSKRNRRKN